MLLSGIPSSGRQHNENGEPCNIPKQDGKNEIGSHYIACKGLPGLYAAPIMAIDMYHEDELAKLFLNMTLSAPFILEWTSSFFFKSYSTAYHTVFYLKFK